METGRVVSIIIVTNDHRDFIERCIRSVLKQKCSYQKEIILIDNKSRDSTVNIVREKFPQVHVLQRSRKYGFAVNNNLAIRQSKGRYILLLNPDTEMSPGALQSLTIYMDSHTEVGVCGPQLRFPDGNLQYSCRRFPNWQTFLVRRSPLRLFLRDSNINRHHLMTDVDHSHVQDVDWLLGACMCIRRDVFRDVGYFDERYFMYVEDIDFCLRIHRTGWKIYYVPTAKVMHHHLAASDEKLLSLHSLYHVRSMILYLLKHGVIAKTPYL